MGEGVRGWVRSRIIRPKESLVLYKSFNTLGPCALPGRRRHTVKIKCKIEDFAKDRRKTGAKNTFFNILILG